MRGTLIPPKNNCIKTVLTNKVYIQKSQKRKPFLLSPLAQVDLAHPVGVDRVPLVWVDDNHKEA